MQINDNADDTLNVPITPIPPVCYIRCPTFLKLKTVSPKKVMLLNDSKKEIIIITAENYQWFQNLDWAFEPSLML